MNKLFESVDSLFNSDKALLNEDSEREFVKTVKGPNGQFFDIYKKDGKYVDEFNNELDDQELKDYKLQEETLEESEGSTLELYQVSEGKTRDYSFESLEMLDKRNVKLSLNDYTKVADIDYSKYTDSTYVNTILELLFKLTNSGEGQEIRNENPNMRSVSVSDIALLDGKYYYCDDFGWTDVTDRLTGVNESEDGDLKSQVIDYLTSRYGEGFELEDNVNGETNQDEIINSIVYSYEGNEDLTVAEFVDSLIEPHGLIVVKSKDSSIEEADVVGANGMFSINCRELAKACKNLSILESYITNHDRWVSKYVDKIYDALYSEYDSGILTANGMLTCESREQAEKYLNKYHVFEALEQLDKSNGYMLETYKDISVKDIIEALRAELDKFDSSSLSEDYSDELSVAKYEDLPYGDFKAHNTLGLLSNNVPFWISDEQQVYIISYGITKSSEETFNNVKDIFYKLRDDENQDAFSEFMGEHSVRAEDPLETKILVATGRISADALEEDMSGEELTNRVKQGILKGLDKCNSLEDIKGVIDYYGNFIGSQSPESKRKKFATANQDELEKEYASIYGDDWSHWEEWTMNKMNESEGTKFIAVRETSEGDEYLCDNGRSSTFNREQAGEFDSKEAAQEAVADYKANVSDWSQVDFIVFDAEYYDTFKDGLPF